MTVWVIEFDHQDGTEIWVATSKSIADAVVKEVQRNIFNKRDPDHLWTLKRASEDWPEYSGHTEFFRINEVSLLDTVEAAKKAAI